jgi:hypothetical protein
MVQPDYNGLTEEDNYEPHRPHPARYGSTRFPGKALADILGNP